MLYYLQIKLTNKFNFLFIDIQVNLITLRHKFKSVQQHLKI